MTSDLKHLPQRDVERLSAYLDHELAQAEQAKLEERLQEEPRLRRALAELRGTVRALNLLPDVEPPRNFTLTPEMVGQRRPGDRYPLLQFATAFAALAFLVVIGFDAVVSNSLGGGFGARSAEIPAPMAQQAAPREETLMQAQQEEPAEGEPSVADEMGGVTTDSTAAGTPSPASTPLAETERESAATAPAGLAAAPPTAFPSTPTAGIEPGQFPQANEPAGGPSATQTLMRLTEIILALAVIVLAAATAWRRPIGS
jgi:hypothetical protein